MRLWLVLQNQDKRQFGVVAHLRLCASELLRHGRKSPVPF